ncbi:equilibrative nucleobase transporter 1-like [Amphiura filiformis]|uniref:equilibrative nucleobase transporter 1-like n=1 Tax=Amphiura filiformis TaxID=82378 RepID=UPI003B21AB09
MLQVYNHTYTHVRSQFSEGTMAHTSIIKHILVTFCFLECLLLSGFIFGWSSLVYVFKELGYFHKYCNHSLANSSSSLRISNNVTTEDGLHNCHEQDAALDLVFTISAVGSMLCLFPLGAVIDRFGVIIGRVTSGSLLCFGLLLAAFTTPKLSELLFPACLAIASGGLLLLVVDIKIVANLKLRRKGTAIAFLDSAFDSSAFVTVVIQIAYNLGLHYRLSFFVILSLCTISMVTTLCTVLYSRASAPDTNDVPLEFADPQNKIDNAFDNPGLDNNGDIPTIPPDTNSDPVDKTLPITPTYQIEKRFPTLHSAMGSALFISLLIWMGLLHLRWTFFIGAFNVWIERLTDHDKILVNNYTFICNMIQFGGILTAPAQGYLLDRRIVSSSRDPLRDLKNCRLTFFITALIFSVFSLCVAIPVLQLQIVSFVLLSIARCFLYSLVSAFITFTFPTDYLGRLYGMTSIVNAVMTVIQFPLFVATEGSELGFYVNVIFLPITLLSFIHPVYLHFYIKNTLKPKLTGTSSTIRLEG